MEARSAEARVERRRELLASGVTDGELRRRLRARELVVLRRGAYLPSDALPKGPEARHALRVRAAHRDLAPDAVVSHVSAAVLHGLPVWAVPLDRINVTRPRRAGARRSAALHVHAAPLDPDERTEIDGVAVTSVARTLADLARWLPFEQAVCVADAGLFRQPVTPADLAAAVARAARRPGNPHARRVLAFADGLSESVGESRSRVALQRADLPRPVLQQDIRSAAGTWLARVDFWWPEPGIVGEFDGAAKYGRLLAPGQDPGDVVYREKLREDALRAEGHAVVRWTWPDLAAFAPTAARLRRALAARP